MGVWLLLLHSISIFLTLSACEYDATAQAFLLHALIYSAQLCVHISSPASGDILRWTNPEATSQTACGPTPAWPKKCYLDPLPRILLRR